MNWHRVVDSRLNAVLLKMIFHLVPHLCPDHEQMVDGTVAVFVGRWKTYALDVLKFFSVPRRESPSRLVPTIQSLQLDASDRSVNCVKSGRVADSAHVILATLVPTTIPYTHSRLSKLLIVSRNHPPVTTNSHILRRVE